MAATLSPLPPLPPPLKGVAWQWQRGSGGTIAAGAAIPTIGQRDMSHMTKHNASSRHGEKRLHGRSCRRCGRAVAGFSGYCKRCTPDKRIAWRVRIDQHLVTIDRSVMAIRRALEEDR